MTLGEVTDHGFDGEGYQRLERVGAIAECPNCGEEVCLLQETEAWVESENGKWLHSEWSPAMGVCESCDLLLVDDWDGCCAYDLSPEKEP